jgi:putative transposase
MARLRRIVLPGIPHHVTQRGNRRERVFFEEGDYALYLDLLSEAAARSHVAIWAYCLMPNHVHIIAVPSDEDGLRRTFRYVHRHYTGYINARMRVTGHLWQGRFSSVAMDEAHLVCALRYVALNPVRARAGRSSGRMAVVEHQGARRRQERCLCRCGAGAGARRRLRGLPGRALRRGADLCRAAQGRKRRPGSKEWLADVEARTGLTLAPGKRGPKPKAIRGYCTCHRNSTFHPLIASTQGVIPASTARVAAHELGHSIMGTDDDGPGRMNNVRQNENAIMRPLGEPERTQYERPH